MPSNSPAPEKRQSPGNGRLFVVSTPIGNLEDITLRALKTLQQVEWIAAEDTRHTRKLLSAHHIPAGRLIAFHEHNERQRTAELILRLQQGIDIAIVSNAGTPTVSDPGFRLVRAAVEHHITVVPIPGVSAAITALSGSGLPSDAFSFVGFPARKKARRTQQLQSLASLAHTLIFYESPRRVIGLLEEIRTVMGDRHAVVAREMTKLHEEFIRGPISEVLAALNARDDVKGECTILVEGVLQKTDAGQEALEQAVNEALQQDRPLSELARQIAKQFGLPRKVVYDLALRLRK